MQKNIPNPYKRSVKTTQETMEELAEKDIRQARVKGRALKPTR